MPNANRASMTAPIRRLLLKHARDAFIDQAKVGREWARLQYTNPPDVEQAVADYEAFTHLFRRLDIEIHFMPPGEATRDAIYVRDAAATAPDGVILGNMGKAARQDEPAALGAYLNHLKVPILGTVTGTGRLEGAPKTKALLEHHGVEVWTYPGAEISAKGRGGSTCLTQPLVRAA